MTANSWAFAILPQFWLNAAFNRTPNIGEGKPPLTPRHTSLSDAVSIPRARSMRLSGETGMLKKIALAAVAATLIAGPALASTKLETSLVHPDAKDLSSTRTIGKSSLQHVKHKVVYKKNMEKSMATMSAT